MKDMEGLLVFRCILGGTLSTQAIVNPWHVIERFVRTGSVLLGGRDLRLHQSSEPLERGQQLGQQSPTCSTGFLSPCKYFCGSEKLLFIRFAPANVPDWPEPKCAVRCFVCFGLVYGGSGLPSGYSCRFKTITVRVARGSLQCSAVCLRAVLRKQVPVTSQEHLCCFRGLQRVVNLHSWWGQSANSKMVCTVVQQEKDKIIL